MGKDGRLSFLSFFNKGAKAGKPEGPAAAGKSSGIAKSTKPATAEGAPKPGKAHKKFKQAAVAGQPGASAAAGSGKPKGDGGQLKRKRQEQADGAKHQLPHASPGSREAAAAKRPRLGQPSKPAPKHQLSLTQQQLQHANKDQPPKQHAPAPPFRLAAPPGASVNGSGQAQQHTAQKNNKKHKQRRSGTWPFPVDYNDHFETSQKAIQDLQPVLEQLGLLLRTKRDALRVYDPFYCKGGIRRHWEALGFKTFIHENRDFYADVEAGTIPPHDVLVTNPPYSGDHKERALEHCLSSGAPWALLLPNYVATKQYYLDTVARLVPEPSQRPFYITPSVAYAYEHPEGTGHGTPPFFSIWYVGGLGGHTERVFAALQAQLQRPLPLAGAGGRPGGGGPSLQRWDVALARSVADLRQAKAVPTGKRLNPKQRRKLREKLSEGGGRR